MRKSIAITGATGMLGLELIKQMLEENVKVCCFVRPESSKNKYIPDSELVNVIPVELNELDKVTFDEKLQCEEFYHFGWSGTTGADRNNTVLQEENVSATIKAVKLASQLGCKKFMFAGSQAECGRVNGLITTETPANPENEYGRCKNKAAILAEEECKRCGINFYAVRILSVYGPFNVCSSMIMSAIQGMYENGEADFTKGEQNWDYMYVSDAIRAITLVMKKGIPGKRYPIGSGVGQPIEKYIEIIRSAIERIANKQIRANMGVIPYGENVIMNLQANIDELVKDTGFEVETSHNAGFEKTIKWYIEQKKEWCE